MAKFGIEKFAGDLCEMLRRDIVSAHQCFEDRVLFGSPIETLFFVAFIKSVPIIGPEYGFDDVFTIPKDRPIEEFYIRSGVLVIVPQATLIDWRVDFHIFVVGQPEISVVIECDGHDFHERTKEQAARDRSRDRALQAAGHVALRFTGSEIYRDPLRCAQETLSQLRKLEDRKSGGGQ